MKKVGIVAMVLASALFISGQAKTNKVVEANEFRLVDGSGKLRAVLSMSAAARPELLFYDQAGTSGAISILQPDSLNMFGAAGRFEVEVNKAQGGPSISVTDKAGYSSVLERPTSL